MLESNSKETNERLCKCGTKISKDVDACVLCLRRERKRKKRADKRQARERAIGKQPARFRKP